MEKKTKKKKGVKRTGPLPCPLKRYNIDPNNNSKNMIILVKHVATGLGPLCVILTEPGKQVIKMEKYKNPPKRQHISITGESIKTVPSLCTSIEFKTIIQSLVSAFIRNVHFGAEGGAWGSTVISQSKRKVTK